MLVFDHWSGLNRSRLAQIANIATIRSSVVTPIMALTPNTRRREIARSPVSPPAPSCVWVTSGSVSESALVPLC